MPCPVGWQPRAAEGGRLATARRTLFSACLIRLEGDQEKNLGQKRRVKDEIKKKRGEAGVGWRSSSGGGGRWCSVGATAVSSGPYTMRQPKALHAPEIISVYFKKGAAWDGVGSLQPFGPAGSAAELCGPGEPRRPACPDLLPPGRTAARRAKLPNLTGCSGTGSARSVGRAESDGDGAAAPTKGVLHPGGRGGIWQHHAVRSMTLNEGFQINLSL